MLEPNNIYLGDCYKLIKEIPDKSVDCVYVDIPYLLIGGGGGNSRIAKNWTSLGQQLEDANIIDGISQDIYKEFIRVCKTPNIFIWCSRLQVREILDWFNENTDTTMNILTWNKTNPVPCNTNWLSDIEYCLTFQDNAKFNTEFKYKSKWYVSPINQKDKKEYGHPTIKPFELVKRHLLNATQTGGVVLDCFMGSGTTCAVCKEIGRKYIGIEINEDYFNIAKKRLDETTYTISENMTMDSLF